MSIILMIFVGIIAIFLLVEFRWAILGILLVGYCLLADDPMDVLGAILSSKLGLFVLLIPIAVIAVVIEKFSNK